MKVAKQDYYVSSASSGKTRQTLLLEHNPTVMLVWAANRFNRSASKFFQDRFGITAMDWRMMVMLCKEPGCAVSKATPMVGFDKAAVSRSLKNLESLGLASAKVEGSNARHKRWSLTPQGLKLHDKILAATLAREQAVMMGLSAQEVESLSSMLQKLLLNMESLDEREL